jgi:hypothetical protein
MFNQDRGATASYRTLARGRGCAWVRTYQAAPRSQASQRASSVVESGRGVVESTPGVPGSQARPRIPSRHR